MVSRAAQICSGCADPSGMAVRLVEEITGEEVMLLNTTSKSALLFLWLIAASGYAEDSIPPLGERVYILEPASSSLRIESLSSWQQRQEIQKDGRAEDPPVILRDPVSVPNLTSKSEGEESESNTEASFDGQSTSANHGEYQAGKPLDRSILRLAPLQVKGVARRPAVAFERFERRLDPDQVGLEVPLEQKLRSVPLFDPDF